MRHHHRAYAAPHSTLSRPGASNKRNNPAGANATSLEDDPELSFGSYSGATGSRDNTDSPLGSGLVPEFKIGRLDFVDDESEKPSDTLLPGYQQRRQRGETSTSMDDVSSDCGAGDRTIGELRVPRMQSDALASPLGSVPSLEGSQQEYEPTFGSLPGDFGRPQTRDSGVLFLNSGDFVGGAISNCAGGARAKGDGMSDAETSDPAAVGGGEFPGGRVGGDDENVTVSSELEEALKKLTPQEVERRRQRLSSETYR